MNIRNFLNRNALPVKVAHFFCLYMQSMQLPEKYPKPSFLPLYEEELKNIKQ